jgi:hypothetical protein
MALNASDGAGPFRQLAEALQKGRTRYDVVA